MSLLDDLKQQAGKQQPRQSTEQTPVSAEAADFYRQRAKARMLAAYQYLNELMNQLNEMKLDTRANYPFKPEGKPVALMQQDYKAFNDSITDPRQITVSFNCTLVNPTSFEVNGRAAVLAQGEVLDRYRFKYEKIEQKDPRQMVTSARFKLVGPLAVRFMLQVDESRQVIKLIQANFAGPGASQYHLKPEQLDEAFLDQLGKYILRKEANLFKQELSEDIKAKLRQKLQQERQQREAELQEIEAARQAEEALRKQNSTTSQLKKAVSQTVSGNTGKLKKAMNDQLKRVMQTQVAKGKDSLKGIFDKLKKPAQAPQQTSPAQSTAQAASISPTRPAQPQQRVAAKAAMSAHMNTPAKVSPSGHAPTAEHVRTPVPAGVNRPKPDSPASPAAVKTATVKKTQPPKVYNAPPNNPFLKPEPSVDSAEQEAATASAPEPTPVVDLSTPLEMTLETPQAETTKVNDAPPNNPFLTPASPVDAAEPAMKTAPAPEEPEATPEADLSTPLEMTLETPQSEPIKVNDAPPSNPFLKPASPVDTAEQAMKTAAAPQEPEATMVIDISSHPELSLKTQAADRANVNNAASTNPFLKPTLSVDAAEREVKKTAPASQEPEATMVMDISSHPELTLKMQAADRANQNDAAEVEENKAAAPLTLEPIPVADRSSTPDATPASPLVPPVDVGRDVKQAEVPLAFEAKPVADIPSRPDVTPESLEADLARIIERDKQNKPQ